MKIKQINADGKRIIVKVEERANEVGGIIIPNPTDQNLKIGEIVSISKSRELDFFYHKVGDFILFSEHSATKINLDDFENHYILDIDNILADLEIE